MSDSQSDGGRKQQENERGGKEKMDPSGKVKEILIQKGMVNFKEKINKQANVF